MSEESKPDVQTVELPEAPEVKAEVKTPTVDELKAEGWSESEIETAKQEGLIPKEEAKKEEAPVTEAEDKKEEKKAEPERRAEKRELPDYDMTPEQKKKFREDYGVNIAGLYGRVRSERLERQKAQAELKALREELDRTRSMKPAGEQAAETEDGPDPDDVPITPRRLRQMQEEEAKKAQEMQSQASIVNEALSLHEAYAKEYYTDFKEATEACAETLKNVEEWFPDPKKQSAVVAKIKELQLLAANAHHLKAEERNATDVVYELAQLNPNFKKKESEAHDGTEYEPDSKANGGHTPEQMKRIDKNTQRRGSSASVPSGSGRRVVDAEDVTLEDLSAMSEAQMNAFEAKHPSRFAKLMRG